MVSYIMYSKVKQDVFVTHYAPNSNTVQKASFSTKVTIYRRSQGHLTLVLFERATLIEYTC